MKSKNVIIMLIVGLILMVCVVANSQADPMGTAFTYQGRFIDSNSPADGTYDFEYKLYDNSTGGTQLGNAIYKDNLEVIDGYFTTELDFGSGVFDGSARWLDISVRPGDSSGSYTTLNPRQELTPIPYAMHVEGGSGGGWIDDGTVVRLGTATDYVGIGTTNPVYKFHIQDSSDGRAFLNSSGGSAFWIADSVSNSNSGLWMYEAGTRKWQMYNDGDDSDKLTFKDEEGNEQVTIDQNGNIGIGTTSPQTILHINASLPRISLSQTGNSAEWQIGLSDVGANAKLMFKDIQDNIDRMAIDGEGNVGIGITDPQAKLHVDGTVKGTYFIGNETTNILNSGSAGNGTQSVIRKDATNAYLWPWGTGTPSNAVLVGGGAPTHFIVTGNFSVNGSKNFEIDHPLKRDKDLVHSSLEGPEAGVYYRGESRLLNGKAEIVLPDYFEALTRKENRTVLITPKFGGDEPISMLATSAVRNGKFSVRAVDDKNVSQGFYWEVKAVRSDLPLLKVEKDKRYKGMKLEKVQDD